LLATREDESEGRRRAVAINNMLFSSALGRTAVEPSTPTQRELLLVDPTEGSDLLFELLSTTAGDARMGMGVVSILRNVSDLRRATEETEQSYVKLRAAEAVVRAERDRLNLVIDSVADPILVTDPSGHLVMMNAPAERLFSAAEEASPAAIQRVQANDANFTSFVSNLLFGRSNESAESTWSIRRPVMRSRSRRYRGRSSGRARRSPPSSRYFTIGPKRSSASSSSSS
jgi:PAS domain-containing protein